MAYNIRYEAVDEPERINITEDNWDEQNDEFNTTEDNVVDNNVSY